MSVGLELHGDFLVNYLRIIIYNIILNGLSQKTKVVKVLKNTQMDTYYCKSSGKGRCG